MTKSEFKAKAYVKEKCPFSFKFLVFMAEAGLLDRIDIVRLSTSDPGFEEQKRSLSEHLGKDATFPTVEVAPGEYETDSDRLIARYAAEAPVQAETLPVLSFYQETILPQLIELFQIKHPKSGQAQKQA